MNVKNAPLLAERSRDNATPANIYWILQLDDDWLVTSVYMAWFIVFISVKAWSIASI